MTSQSLYAFNTSYRQWADAQAQVTNYEKVIFSPEHLLTESELSHLQSLRATAAELLSQLVGELDAHLAGLHAGLGSDPFHVPAPAQPASPQPGAGPL